MTFKEFWDWLPVKLDYKDYEEEIEKDLQEIKHLWIKKCAGLGITEFMLRWIAWNCLKDDEWKNKQIDVNVVLITGPRIDLAITIMQRLKALFPDLPKTKETVCVLNDSKIEAYPSHHVASAHGLNPLVVLLEEGDLFPPGQQKEAREVSERYIAKTNPHIIWVSTAYLPGGLFEQIENEENCMYRRKIMLLDRALKSGRYTQEQVEVWKQSPSFRREAWGEYGYGLGDIFSDIDDIIEEYEIIRKGGRGCVTADPAFGASNTASKFGICAGEMIDNICYVHKASEHSRTSPSYMLDVMEQLAIEYDSNCKVDAAHAGFIRDLNERGIPAIPIAFGKPVRDTEKDNIQSLRSKMTINASMMVKNKQVKIHPDFKALIAQMRAVRFDPRGGIDKTESPFDIVDAFIMWCWELKEMDYSAIHLTHDGKIVKDLKPKRSKGLSLKTEVIE